MTVATPISRPTYGGWLDQIAEHGRTDEIGLVATAWAAAKAHGRPKLSAVKSVNAWLSEHPPPGVANLQATLHHLATAYHEAGGLDHQQPAQPANPQVYEPTGLQGQPVEPPGMPVAPATPPPAAFQPPGEIRHLGYEPGEIPGQQALWPADHQQSDPAADAAAWTGQPPPASSQVTAPLVPGDPNLAAALGQDVPEHPWQMVLLAIGRLETQLAGFQAAISPLIALAAEAMSVDEALDASPLSASPQASEAYRIAEQNGWTQGPAFEQPAQPEPAQPDFYGGHVVAPDFASMAQASDGSEEDPG